MIVIHHSALILHILVGFIAMVAFWVPVVSRKGSRLHKQAGLIFTRAMWIISISGIVMCLIAWFDPIAIRFGEQVLSEEVRGKLTDRHRQLTEFLLLLSVLVLVGVKHSTLVLKAKADRNQLKHWSHLFWVVLLFLLGSLILIKAIINGQILYAIFAVLAIVSAIGICHYIFKAQLKQREWIIEHMSAIIGSGIAVYTAFFAVGGRRYLSEVLQGNWQLIPWILPGVIGGLSIHFYKKYFATKFKVQGEAKS
jgi:hypothetical protein